MPKMHIFHFCKMYSNSIFFYLLTARKPVCILDGIEYQVRLAVWYGETGVGDGREGGGLFYTIFAMSCSARPGIVANSTSHAGICNVFVPIISMGIPIPA